MILQSNLLLPHETSTRASSTTPVSSSHHPIGTAGLTLGNLGTSPSVNSDHNTVRVQHSPQSRYSQPNQQNTHRATLNPSLWNLKSQRTHQPPHSPNSNTLLNKSKCLLPNPPRPLRPRSPANPRIGPHDMIPSSARKPYMARTQRVFGSSLRWSSLVST